jgi:hypothetical protein
VVLRALDVEGDQPQRLRSNNIPLHSGSGSAGPMPASASALW